MGVMPRYERIFCRFSECDEIGPNPVAVLDHWTLPEVAHDLWPQILGLNVELFLSPNLSGKLVRISEHDTIEEPVIYLVVGPAVDVVLDESAEIIRGQPAAHVD